MCTKCSQPKDESEYFVKNKSTGRLHSQCKDCYKEYRKTFSADHYAKYGETYRERARLRRARLKRQNQIELIEYMKNKACAICMESDIRVLEFDHLDPTTKSFNIARAVNDGIPWAIILLEIEKCQILCSNCHKKRTATQYGWFKARGLK